MVVSYNRIKLDDRKSVSILSLKDYVLMISFLSSQDKRRIPLLLLMLIMLFFSSFFVYFVFEEQQLYKW